jgi:hypothetical protein
MRGIDIQSMYSRNNDISKTRVEDNAKNSALIHQQNQNINKSVQNDLTQVMKRESAQKASIREKQEKEKSQKRKKNKNKNEENKNILDIKI